MQYKFEPIKLECEQDSWQLPDSLFTVVDDRQIQHICCVCWDDPHSVYKAFVSEHIDDTKYCGLMSGCQWEAFGYGSIFLNEHQEIATAALLWATSGGYEMPLYQFLNITLHETT
jgi:hypothetical protein